MPLNFIKEKKKQNYMILAAIAIFVVAGAIFWFGYSGKDSSEPTVEPIAGSANPIVRSIDFSIFESPILKKLEPFFQLPVFEGKIGRENPFEK
ncbi:MAG: hypothetical protein Q8N69_02680 [bacterium]|nr:hypothetical protein [bacterium]